MVSTFFVLILTTVLLAATAFLFMTSSEYDDLVEPLDDKQFPLKSAYSIGFRFLDLIHFNFATKSALKLRREVYVLYGENYADYYLRVCYAQKFSLTLLAADATAVLASISGPENILTIFVLGLVMSFCVYYYFSQQSVNTIKALSKRYISEFPSIVSTMALLVNAGMMLREAWDLVSKSGESEMHRQMQKVTEDRNQGMSEADAMTAMAHRCATPEISKFVSMVIQGLDKGSSDLAYTLREQSDEMWELKQQKLLQEGEKAAGKLLIPILVMFIGILLMIMMPILTNLGL